MKNAKRHKKLINMVMVLCLLCTSSMRAIADTVSDGDALTYETEIQVTEEKAETNAEDNGFLEEPQVAEEITMATEEFDGNDTGMNLEENVAEEIVSEENVIEEVVSEETVLEEAVIEGTVSEEATTEETVSEEAEIEENVIEQISEPEINLIVPSNLDFVIDPWGIEGKGQVYSADFVIRNDGASAGVLYLYDLLVYQDEMRAVLVNGNEEIYGTDDRNVYMKMVFSTGEEVVITENCSELEIPMEVGQEIVFWLDGGVNEKSTASWADVLMHVSMKYNWVNAH